MVLLGESVFGDELAEVVAEVVEGCWCHFFCSFSFFVLFSFLKKCVFSSWQS